jgi:hypothetical protein
MTPSSRFASPASDLDLQALLGRLRQTLWLSLALAVLTHLMLVGFNPFTRQAQQAARPLTTKFIKREPRLTKPLELRKIPKRKRQIVRRQVRVASARMSQVQATAAFSTRQLIAGLGGASKIPYGRPLTSPSSDAETGMRLDVDLGISRVAENRIDMGLEMLDVNAMDTGRYRAMVIQDPNDKQALKGFIKLARVHSITFIVDSNYSAAVTGGLNVQEIDILADMINEWTGLQADFVGSVTFDDPRLLEIPLIMPEGLVAGSDSQQSAPTEGELANLARYLLAGGFVLMEGKTGKHQRFAHGAFEGLHKALEKYGGLVEGRDFYTQRLAEDHPLFSAYFDLGGGAPLGAVSYRGLGYFNVVEGFYVKGRLAAIPRPWGVFEAHGPGLRGHTKGRESTRILQFAVNTIVYALTQEGSITQRLMQMVH